MNVRTLEEIREDRVSLIIEVDRKDVEYILQMVSPVMVEEDSVRWDDPETPTSWYEIHGIEEVPS